jgi:hypothetical protein
VADDAATDAPPERLAANKINANKMRAQAIVLNFPGRAIESTFFSIEVADG